MKKLVAACLSISLLLPTTILAQTPAEPGQDPFALSPELLQYFQGVDTADPNYMGLFHGDNLKYSGLFTTPLTQLGGALPITAPVQQTEDEFGPTLIRVTSKYEPGGNLTKNSIIKITVTLKNIGQSTSPAITLRATLEDNNATLITDSTAADTSTPGSSIDPGANQPPSSDGTITPAPPNPTPASLNLDQPEVGILWDKTASGSSIILRPDQSNSFVWYVQPKQDDTVLRWKFVAAAGSAESTLLQWIPIKNPNPTGTLSLNNTTASGVPSSCTNSAGTAPFPSSSDNSQIISQISSRWNIHLRNGHYAWTDAPYKPLLQVFWDTLSAVECTPFLQAMLDKNGGRLDIYAMALGGYWGDYGLTMPGALSINTPPLLDLANNGTPEKVTWLIIHEMAHAYSNDRPAPAYYAQYLSLWNTHGAFTNYGSGAENENFADIVGYYVARCAVEGGAQNPYARNIPATTAYYQYVKTSIFGGQEFGPTAPAAVSCG